MGKFYITTPIFYVNDKPHIGHAYNMISADVIARWHRLKGDKVWFLAGTDEHGEKIADAAAASKMTPIQFTDILANKFKSTWSRLDISNDDFIRTTEKRHEDVVDKLIDKIYKNGDIYKGMYEGWYCVSDETFYTELQLKEGKCPDCGREVKLLKEESYFFKLSKYQDKLLAYYKKNPDFLSPKYRASEITNRVKAGLKDLSITRSSVKWGIPFKPDKKHTIYVWVEALMNYVSALGWPEGTFDDYWPADVHLVGKEINWFHSVIWPAMLMSAEIKPPKKVFAHGWWTVEGEKMSKSKGNALDPILIADKYSIDALRYFLVREMPLGDDGDFSEKHLVERINGELASDLGNLLSRVLTLAERHKGKFEGKPELESDLEMDAYSAAMEGLELSVALDVLWRYIKSANKYINDNRPWELQGKELDNAMYNLLEATRVIAILVSPFMPGTTNRINEQLGVKAGKLKDCKFREFKGKVKKGKHLFEKVG